MNNSKFAIRNSKFKKAFTLIELLVVIAIIALLAGLLMPALRGARIAAQKAKCGVMINGVGMALKAYYNEYGIWPNTAGTVPTTILTAIANSNLVNCLMGQDVDLGGTAGGNPRKIVFLDVKNSEIKEVDTAASNGVYPKKVGSGNPNLIDPFGCALMFRFDNDGDNQVEVYEPSACKTRGGFAIWSAGYDKKVDSSETDANTPTKTDNKDNVTSWK